MTRSSSAADEQALERNIIDDRLENVIQMEENYVCFIITRVMIC